MFPFPSLDLALGIITDWRLTALFIACGGRGRSGRASLLHHDKIHRIPQNGPRKALQYSDDFPPPIAAIFLLSPTPFNSAIVRSPGVLLVRANFISSRSFIQPAMFDLQSKWTVGEGGGGREKLIFTSSPSPLSLLLTFERPPGTNLFSPQPSAVIKIKDGGHNFRYEITELSLAKITPAQQANSVRDN